MRVECEMMESVMHRPSYQQWFDGLVVILDRREPFLSDLNCSSV